VIFTFKKYWCRHLSAGVSGEEIALKKNVGLPCEEAAVGIG